MRGPLQGISKSLVYCAVFLGVFWIFKDFAILKLNTADASTYLNIGENIAAGRGFVVSFNLYQFFNTHFYPIWSYMQPAYPLICALIMELGGSIQQVITVNILILSMNAAVILYLADRYIPSRLNIFVVFGVVLSFNFFLSGLFAWTEQLHLFVFLASFICFLRYFNDRRWLFILGCLNAAMMLIRFAHIYNLAAFIWVLYFWTSPAQRRKHLFLFILGFLTIYAPYQLFCWASEHAWYAQYLHAAREYAQAKSIVAVYQPGGITIPDQPFNFMENAFYFGNHILSFLVTIPILALALIFLPSVVRLPKEKSFFVWNCTYQGVFVVLGYSYNLSWFHSIDAARYCLIPHVLASLSCWFCIYELMYRPSKPVKKAFVLLALVLWVVFYVHQSFKIQANLLENPRGRNPYYRDLFQAYDWINGHLPKDVLLASNEDQEGYFLHRPFISMPPGRSYNCANLQMYNKIYMPDYYLLSSGITDRCFMPIEHKQVYSNNTFRLLQVKK